MKSELITDFRPGFLVRWGVSVLYFVIVVLLMLTARFFSGELMLFRL